MAFTWEAVEFMYTCSYVKWKILLMLRCSLRIASRATDYFKGFESILGAEMSSLLYIFSGGVRGGPKTNQQHH